MKLYQGDTPFSQFVGCEVIDVPLPAVFGALKFSVLSHLVISLETQCNAVHRVSSWRL